MNRRKMGTSRRSKGRQLLKDPEKQPDIESREDVQDETRGNKHSEKYESAAKQPEVQEEVSQETKCGITASKAAFLVPATTEYTEDETGMFCLEEAEHTLVSRDVNIHSFKDETKLELALQSEKVNKNLHDSLPDATGLSATALDQQMISKKTEDINLYSVAESKSNKPEDIGLFRQDARLPCNFSVDESHVNTSITPQITADNALRENIKNNDGIKQELSQKEELPTSKDGELFITPEVRDAQHSEQGEENVYDQNKPTQMQGDHQKDLLHDQEDYDSYSESQKSKSDSSQIIFLVKSTAVKQDASLGQMDQSGVLMEDNIKQIGESVCIEGILSETEKNNLSVQTLVSDLKAPTEPQLQLTQTTDEHTEPDFIFGSTKRQLGSSRRNKGKRLVESKEDILGNTQTTETSTELPELKETGQEEVSEDTADDIILSLSHGSLVSLVSPHISSEDPETDSRSLILDSENFQKDQDETNPKILVKVVENSDVSVYDVDQSDTLHSKGTIDSLLENVLGKVQEVEVHSTQMQKSLQIKHSSETSSGVITKDFENILENLTDQAKISEFAGKSNDNFTTKHKEHQTEENILKDTESIQLKNESYDLQKPNSAPSHVHEFKKGVENDLKLTKDQMFTQENKGLFLEMEKKETVLFDPQPQEASGSVDEQFNKAFHSSVNRRKLGFSRKSKGRQDTDSKEAKEKTSDEETTQKTDIKIMSQDELRLDMEHDVILPVSHDSSMLSIIPSGQSLEVQSSMPNIYPENDPQSLIPETDINMELSDESWEVTSGCQSDTLRSKSGIHQTKHVKGPYPGDKVGRGEEHEALQTQAQEPQQMDYTVDSYVGGGGVFVEDTKNNPTNPQLQDHSLSTNEETNAGFSFSGSRKKLASSRRKNGRQQGKESTEEALHNTRSDKTQETPSMIMQEELNEDNEPRISISVSNTRSLFPNPPLDQSDLMGLIVKCENLHENQNESKSDTANIMDVSQQAVEKFEASYSEDTSNAVAEDLPRKDGGVEVYPTKMEKSLQAEHLSETVPCGITGNFLNFSENLTNQPYMSELNLKTNDDSAAKQENYAEAVDVKNKDSGLYGTNQPQISDLEKIDPAPIEVEEFKARVENNLQVTNPHTLHQQFHLGKKGFFSELEENKAVSSSFQSETVSSDSKPQEMPDSVDKETNTSFYSTGKRRKMGSSRSSKGRQQDKTSEDVKEKSRDVLTLELSCISLETKTTIQEELQQDRECNLLPVSNNSSMFTPGRSSEIQSFIPCTYPETDLVSLISKDVYFTKNQDESETGNNVDLFEKSGKDTLVNKSETLQNQERIGPEHSENAVKQADEHEGPPTDIAGSLHMDYTSETVAHDVPKYPETVLGDRIDHSEIINSIQSELTVKSNNGSDTKPERLPAKDQQNLCFTTEENVEALDQTSKQDHLYYSKETSISSLVGVNTTLGQKDEGESLVEGSKHNPTDPKLQDNPPSTDEQTDVGFSFSGNRRKLVSSQINKGRQGVIKSTLDVLENSRTDSTIDTSTMSLQINMAEQEELSKDTEDDILSVSHDISRSTVFSSEHQSFVVTKGHETDLKSLIMKCENLQEDIDQRNFNVLAQDGEQSSDLSLSKYKALHSEDARDTVLMGNSISRNEKMVPDDTKPKADQIFHQEKEGIFHEMEEDKHVLSKLQPETVPLNPHPQKTSECAYEQINTDFSNSASRRKLGSSRKSKARRQLKESEEEINEKTWVDETPEITQISLDTKTVSQEEQRQDVEQDMTLKVSYDTSVFSVFTPGDLSEIQSSMQKNYPETDLDSLTQGIVNHPGDQDESKTSKVDLSFKSEEESSLDKSDLMESTDETLQNKEVISPEHSKNDVKQADEQDDPPTNIERSLQMDYTSETVAHDVPKYPETVLGDMIDQAEIMSSIQSELMKCSDGSATKQGLLPAEDQQNLCFSTEGNVEALDQICKDDHLYDSKKTWMADGVNTTSGQVDEGEGLIGDIKHSPANAQPQEASGNMDKQSNKEKLGFSCKSEGRQQDKDFKNEVREKSSGEETTQTSLDTKIMSQEELRLDMEHDVILPVSHDSSMLSIIPSGQSLEVQSSMQKIYPENDPQSLIPETDINMELSDESWEMTSGCQSDTLRGKSGIHQTKHVKGPYPGDKVGRGEEHEALQTQAQEPQQMDYTVDSYVGEGGVFVEDTKKPTNPQLQDHSLSTNKQTNVDFSFSVSRRKLGSSRRNKGKQQGKESTEEALHNTRSDKTHETPSMSSLPSMTVEQEELIEDNKNDITLSVSHDSSMALIPPVISFDDQSSVLTNYPDKDMQSLIVKKCNLQEDLERNSDNLVQDGGKSADLSINKSDCFYRGDTGNAVSENAVDDVHEDIHSTQIQDTLQTNSNETFRGDAAENVEIVSGTLTDQAEVSELKVKTIEETTTKEDAYPLKGITSDFLGLKNEETVQHDVKPNTDQELHQDKEGLFCEMEENEFAFSSLQSEKKSFNFQPQESSESVDNPTEVYLHSSGNRKKFGSSRRNKSRSKTKDSADETYNQPIKRVNVNASINELCEKTTETAVQGQEKSMSNVLDEVEENESSQTEDVNTGTSDCTAVGIQPSPTVDQEVTDTSCCVPIKDRELPKPHSRDEYRELCMLNGNLQEGILFPEPHAACPPTTEKSSCSEHTEPESRDGDAFKKSLEQETKPTQSRGMFQTTEKDIYDAAGNHETYFRNQTEKKAMDEVTEMSQPDENVQSKHLYAASETEKNSNMYHAQAECSIEQGAVLSPDMFSTDAEENRHITLSRAAETHDLVYVVSKDQKEQVKTKQMQETHQILLPNECPRQTLHLNKDATLDSQPLENYQGLKDDGHLGLKASGNKRKMGSSRRNKGRKHSQVTEQNPENKDYALESTGDDKTTQMLAARTTGQEELENLILPENVATFTSTVTEKVLEENTVFAHDVLEDSAIATSNFNPNSNQENSLISNAETKEKNAKPIETEDSIQLIGYDTDKKGLMQSVQASVWKDGSNMQSILFHDSIISLKPESVHVIDQEEALQRQNRDALSCGKDLPGPEVHFQQTNKEIETIGFGTEDCSSGGESSMDVYNLKQEEVGENCTFATQQKHSTNEFVSDSQEPAMHASYKGGNSTPINALDSQGEKPQVTSKQKKKKIGSSRRTPMSRKREGETHKKDETEESDFSTKADMMNLGEMDVVGEVPVNVESLQDEDVNPQQQTLIQQETPETETSDGLQSSNTSLVFPPEQSANIDLIETPKPDDFSSTETRITSEVAERNSNVINQSIYSNTGTPGGSLELFCDLSQNIQGDEHSPENIEVRQVQDIQEQMPSIMTQGIQSQHRGIRKSSPDLTPTNRRRKMGSTRKNLGTRTKQEIMDPENESTDTVTSSGDVTVVSVSGKEDTELQLHTEHIYENSHQGKEKETMEISPFGESLLRALAEEMAEECSISEKQMVETEQQQSPSGLSSSPPSSESASGGRRKKFGSNRKSGLQQRKLDQNPPNKDKAGGTVEGGAHKEAEGENSSGLSKISEVYDNEKASSSTNISEPAEYPKPVRENTQEKLLHGAIRLDQESGSHFSFGTTSDTDKSDCYNVVMIGESCVGKTSFMKRAQSGKFSLELPASVGLDSCKWTVVVDGKPMVLQLWDTAGQERFHSITRQVFHKAQAFLLMYDITSYQSFSAVSYWANSIQEAAVQDVTVLLLGNKSDQAKRQVKTEQGDILAKEYNFNFMECSAATGENVIEALETVARMLSHRADLLREEVTVLHREPAQRKTSKCC